MATPAQIAANIANSRSSTGPATEEGKAASSQNAVTTGLFAVGALIRPGEEPIYAELEASLHAELCPTTLLEENLLEEILGAMWRLRRCRLIESSLSPLDDDTADRRQASVDRARAQASRVLHKATAELRSLQTERHYRNEVLPEGTPVADLGVCDFEKVMRATDRTADRKRRLERQTLEDYFAPVTKRTQNSPSLSLVETA